LFRFACRVPDIARWIGFLSRYRPRGYSEGLERLSVLGNVEEFETRAGRVQHLPTPCRLLTPTVELAKARADKELIKHGRLRILWTLDSCLILFSLNANL
jgi:hypothetical protein